MKHVRTTARPFTLFAKTVVVSVALSALAVVAAGCSERQLPGVAIGRYRITGKQSSNTCGKAGRDTTWKTNTINISRDGATLYWDWLDGSPTIGIPLDANGSGVLPSDVNGNIALADGGPSACTMARHDEIGVQFGTAKVPTSFPLTISYAFAAAAGSDCSSQLESAGSDGQYAALPCAFAYDLVATLY